MGILGLFTWKLVIHVCLELGLLSSKGSSKFRASGYTIHVPVSRQLNY